MFYVARVDCNYPTYYDSQSDRCVETCPEGTFGIVNRSGPANMTMTMRNCSSSKLAVYFTSSLFNNSNIVTLVNYIVYFAY